MKTFVSRSFLRYVSLPFSIHKSFSLEGKRMAFELWKAKVSLATTYNGVAEDG